MEATEQNLNSSLINLELNKEYSETVNINESTYEIKYNTNYKTPMANAMMNNINSFDKASWSSDNKGVKTGFSMLDNAFQNGMPSGFYMIGSYPNVGKTSYVTQITYQMLDNNDDIFILDFSLDDPLLDKISRMVGSWVRTPSKAIKFPNEQDEITLAKRRAGMAKLVNNADKYLLYDSAKHTVGNTIEAIEEVIEATKIELEKTRPKTQMVVVIDSFHDLMVGEHPNYKETERQTKVAEWCADVAIKHDLVLITTGEVNKGERNNSRPYPELLKGAGKILFEAKAIMMLYNDVHANNDDAEVFWTNANDPKKLPVLEVHVCKNKIDSWKGRLFYFMDPSVGYLKECDENQTSHFKNIIYK